MHPAPRRSRARARRPRVQRLARQWSSPVFGWQLPRGAGVAAAFVFILASVIFGVVRGGHWPVIAAELRDARDAVANAAGFGISSVALTGQRQLSRDGILAAAGITDRTSLLFLDAAEVRARLKSNPWIAEATVLKLYPRRLHLAVTERDAFALWQKGGKVAVISGDGTVIEPAVSEPFARLPLVVGQGAETRAKDFLALIERYPLLRNQMQAAILVAERRWTLKLASGISVRLPEENTERALDTLVQLDRDKKLLSRDIIAIDLRLPERVTVRLSDEAAAAREEALKDKKPKKKAGDA